MDAFGLPLGGRRTYLRGLSSWFRRTRASSTRSTKPGRPDHMVLEIFPFFWGIKSRAEARSRWGQYVLGLLFYLKNIMKYIKILIDKKGTEQTVYGYGCKPGIFR